MAGHGLDDIGNYFDALRRFTMLDRAGDITCPTLIGESAGDPVGGHGTQL